MHNPQLEPALRDYTDVSQVDLHTLKENYIKFYGHVHHCVCAECLQEILDEQDGPAVERYLQTIRDLPATDLQEHLSVLDLEHVLPRNQQPSYAKKGGTKKERCNTLCHIKLLCT